MAGIISSSVRYSDAWNFVVEQGPPEPFRASDLLTGVRAVRGLGWRRNERGERVPNEVTFEVMATDGGDAFGDWALGDPDATRDFIVWQKGNGDYTNRFCVGACRVVAYHADDFDRGAEDQKRVQRIVVQPASLNMRPAKVGEGPRLAAPLPSDQTGTVLVS